MDFYYVTFFKSKPNERFFLVYAGNHIAAINAASDLVNIEKQDELEVFTFAVSKVSILEIRLGKDDEVVELTASEWKSVFKCITQEVVVFEEKDAAWQPDENLQH